MIYFSTTFGAALSYLCIYRHVLLVVLVMVTDVRGWPLLIQRSGICIWLLFVNQWCEWAGHRGSPRLSHPLFTTPSPFFTPSVCLNDEDSQTVETQSHTEAKSVDIMQLHETALFLADKHSSRLSSYPSWCVLPSCV